MSAFDVKVNADKQTLILKGEPFPSPRFATGGSAANRPATGAQLQRVTMVLVQEDYTTGAPPESAVLPSAVLPSVVDVPVVASQALAPASHTTKRAPSSGAAQYARTQILSGAGPRSQLIDTYA
jgi:hypothetical protein